MKLSTIWSKIGKQPLRISQHKDAKVFVEGGVYYITEIRYENGKFLGFNAIPIKCLTCKHLETPCNEFACREKDYIFWEYGK